MLFLLVAATIFGLDFVVKKYVRERKTVGEEEEILDGRLIICNTKNEGMALGKFKEHKEELNWAVGGAFSCVALYFLLSLLRKGRYLSKLGYSFVVGGGLSNFLDRVWNGYVTDYIVFPVKNEKLRKAVFNISDLFIMLGCLITAIAGIVGIFRKKK